MYIILQMLATLQSQAAQLASIVNRAGHHCAVINAGLLCNSELGVVVVGKCTIAWCVGCALPLNYTYLLVIGLAMCDIACCRLSHNSP